MRIKLNVYLIFKIISVISIFFLSLIISQYYVGGDQIAYNRSYDGIKGLDVFSGYIYYAASTGALEPVYFLFTWILSNIGIEKYIFIAFSNSVLAYVVISLLQKLRVRLIIIVSIVFTNFYFIVLYFSDERLKFGILFLLISILVYPNMKKSLWMSFLALMTHMQTLAIYASLLFSRIYYDVEKLFLERKISKNLLYIIIIFSIPVLILQRHIIHKLDSFAGTSFGMEDLFKSFLFFVMAMFYSKNKKETILIFIPLFVMILFVGGTRLNMFSYFIFLYYALQIKRGLNMGIFISSLYFAYKGLDFINNIILYGTGFN
ncbi:MAG: hypothetical protein QM490_05675 [Candidatus Gracilibacteria bacterium]